MVVYVDLVFLTNLAIDGAVLAATAKALRIRPRRSRILASAALGATYAAAMFWADVPFLYSFGAKVLVSLLMLLISFGYGGPLPFLRRFGTFYAVNFATLGGVIGLGSLLRSAGSPWSAMAVTENGGLVLDWRMQLGLFAVSFLLSLKLFHGTSDIRRKSGETEALLWNVEIWVQGESWSIPALMDTGNRLYDPLTRVPVMVAEASVWQDRLPAGWIPRLRNESADRLVTELTGNARESFAWMDRIRLVPYRGVNGNSRLMLAFKPDSVLLSRNGRAPAPASRILIGLDGGTLASDGSYRAILHPDMIPSGREPPAPSQPA